MTKFKSAVAVSAAFVLALATFVTSHASRAAEAVAALSPPAATPAKAEATTPVPAASAASADSAKPLRKPYESLMFSTDEFNDIRGRISSGGEVNTNDGKQAIENAQLYLSTIVYYSPKDWTIWVNGVPIGPDQEFQSFQVTEINSNYVQLLVPLSAQGMRPVRLSPNQTFITKTGAVVEGRIK